MAVHPIDHSSLRVDTHHTTSATTQGIDNRRPIWRRFYGCLVTLVVLVSIACIGGIVFTEVTNVRNPKVTVNSLKVSNFNLSSHPNQISADWNVQMCLETMDSHGYLKFSDVTVYVYYNEEIIGVTNLMPFDASPKSPPKNFGGEFSGSSGYIDDSIFSKVSQGINAGSLKFNLKFSGWVKKTYIRGRINRSNEAHFVIKCKKVELFFGSSDVSNAQMLNDSHKCSFKEASTD